MPVNPDIGRLASGTPLPHDVKVAIEFLQSRISTPTVMTDLIGHCGVAERTLNEHFRKFLNTSPMRYLRQLRLAAAREALLVSETGISVTEVALRFEFHHFGRFAEQYRRGFGEPPSATLRLRRVRAFSGQKLTENGSAKALKEYDQEPWPALHSRDRPSLAILTCDSSKNETHLDRRAENLSYAIVVALASSRSIAISFPKTITSIERNPQSLARELKTRYFMTGSITQVGLQVRVILRVVETATGHHVWGDSFDGHQDEPLKLQDEIVENILRVILPSIQGAEIDRARRARPENLDAYGLVMRALPFVYASQPDSTRCALELLHRAIELDVDYGLATALAAWGHAQLVMYNDSQAPVDDKLQAIKLNHRAAILDNSDPLVLTIRCAVHTMVGELDVAEALVVRAIALDPYNGWTWGRSAWLHAYRGNSETAIVHFDRAMALDPNGISRANNLAGLGCAYFNIGNYNAAASCLHRAMLENPGIWWANRSLSVSYARMGERTKALESLDTLRRSCPDLTVSRVLNSVPFRPDFLVRLGEGLNSLGLPL